MCRAWAKARAKLLDQELHVRTVGDMLRHFPTRYIDRTKIYRIAEITEGAPALVQFRARVTGVAYAGEGANAASRSTSKTPRERPSWCGSRGIKWIEKQIRWAQIPRASAAPLSTAANSRFEEKVRFADLGFVVIDEQHRFGLEQRARLWTKNERPPHILVMTATPIPRTLAMTLYGDLDVSVIDELPPGRRPIRTYHYTDAARLKLFGFMRQEIAKGRQVYVVYPLIKESEAMDYKDLTDGYEAISRDFPLPDYVTAICHGKMKPADKEESMRQFKQGEAQILVATSVIEVGVDVPNATVMVIESAERFGLAAPPAARPRVGQAAASSPTASPHVGREALARAAWRGSTPCARRTTASPLAELDLKLRARATSTARSRAVWRLI